MCESLLYSIRQSGCNLPVRIIHFGGQPIDSAYILKQAEYLYLSGFSSEAQSFIELLGSVLTCPKGFLYRFLALFSDWEEFIYSDNDIIATSNWEELFAYLDGYDMVHADKEYTTAGRYNFARPQEVEKIFGPGALDAAVTAGHFVMRKRPGITEDLKEAVAWLQNNRNIALLHDQTLLHVAILSGKWKVNNLCKPPHNWLSSWAGDYPNSLSLIHALQAGTQRVNISHIHYSGFSPRGDKPLEDLLFANLDERQRLKQVTIAGLNNFLGISFARTMYKKIKRRLKF